MAELNRADFEAALVATHLPTLAVCVAQAGGDDSLLEDAIYTTASTPRVDTENAKMAWGQQGVTSWYKNAKGRVSQNWPFALVDYWQATRKPDPDAFEAPRRKQAAT